MKSVLLALAVLALSFGAACANDYRCDANGGVYYTTNRVINLPQDQNRMYVTIIGDASDPQVAQITSWFNTNSELRKIAQGTHYSLIDTNSAMYRGRCEQSSQYAPPALPCIRIQDNSGQVVYQVSGRNIPLSAEALVNSMQATCFGCLSNRRVQPAPQPYNYHYHFQVPDKQPETVKPKDQEAIDDVFKGDSMLVIPTWAYFCMGIASIVAAVAIRWVKEYRQRG